MKWIALELLSKASNKQRDLSREIEKFKMAPPTTHATLVK